MKSIVTGYKSEPKELPYPKLMVSKVSGTVVLFTKLGSGTIVCEGYNAYWTNGMGSSGFRMDNFQDFEGTVELSNG